MKLAASAAIVGAAWGVHGVQRNRAAEVMASLSPPLHALALTAAGQPRHPLYLRSTLTPRPCRIAGRGPWSGASRVKCSALPGEQRAMRTLLRTVIRS